MHIHGDVLTFRNVRLLAAQLLVVVLFLRALIPAGFMMDAHAAKSGAFRIVICTAHGSSATVDVDFDNGGEPQKSTPSHDQPCAFAGLAVDFSDAVQDYTVVALVVHENNRIVPARHVLMPPARAGPVLGSRAPPALS